MKVILIVFSFLLFAAINGCDRVTCAYEDPIPTEAINVAISAGETYVYDFGNFGIEDRGPSIQVQATNFEKSEIISRPPTTKYLYKPRANYTGKDFVEFKIESGSTGSAENPNVSIKRITFNVK